MEEKNGAYDIRSQMFECLLLNFFIASGKLQKQTNFTYYNI